jgi:hypothetical protein
MRSNKAILLHKFVLKLPKWVRAKVIRQMIRFPVQSNESLRFKVAETKDELEQAFSLLHDAYVKEKLMSPHPSGLRVTKYHALPSTTTLIALQGKEVIGTLSLIRQSAFGLPMETIFNLSGLPPGSRPVEISSLAIKKGFQQQQGQILFPLLKFMYLYCRDYFGVSHFVIAVNPKWFDFYESVLLFKSLSKNVVDAYDFVNGAPAVGGVLDLKDVERRYLKVYGKKSKHHNLHSFFLELEHANLEFPLRKKSFISDPVLSPELMNHFFNIKTQVFTSLNDFDRTILRDFYNSPKYFDLIPQPTVIEMKSPRSKRYDVRVRGRLKMDDGRHVQFEIQNISKNGFGGILRFPVPAQSYGLLVDLEDDRPCEIEGQIMWQTPRGHFGFKINTSSDNWKYYVQTLDSRLLQNHKTDEKLRRTGT